MRYVYGPVQSRRLGMSLGIDLTPERICSFDCVYCEEGTPTRELTIQRGVYAPTEEIIEQVKALTPSLHQLDYITFSGSGEPTLHADLGLVIHEIKKITKTPISVLTNASLLYRKDVRDDLQEADLIVPSLDAIKNDIFQKINKPPEELDISLIKQGLRLLTQEFSGDIWVEILLVAGINDDMDHLRDLASYVNKLEIQKVHLNTVTRNTTDPNATGVSKSFLEKVSQLFYHPVDIFD